MTPDRKSSGTVPKRAKSLNSQEEKARVISMASQVKLPYEPSSFTIEQLRDALAAVKK